METLDSYTENPQGPEAAGTQVVTDTGTLTCEEFTEVSLHHGE